MGTGFLKVELFVGNYDLPVENAEVFIKDKNGNIIYKLITDKNGQTEKIALEAPDIATILDPYSTSLRFSTYDVEIPNIKGYKKVRINNVQIFDTITSILPIQMYPTITGESPADNYYEINIPLEHGVDIDKNSSTIETSNIFESNYSTDESILANEVIIPQYMTVHLGSPNAVARDVRVPFIDYIKNVASSEIFPYWDEAALYANIYCQISFALNRVYTVWYRSRGKDFDITNNTAFDQFFVEGREIFGNISRIVDNIFNMFIRRPGRREPFFASYCNGTTSTCNGLSQWGSQSLAQKGYSPIQILRNYFPNDVQIVESNNFSSQIGTFPGVPLKEGSRGEDVKTMQIYLNRISGNWYISPIGNVDGIFGSSTKNTTQEFQRIFNLIADGIIGKSTWYEITKIYVAVKELAELTSEGERIGIGKEPPTTTIQLNARGELVVELQFLLNYISIFFPSIPFVIENGVFRENTKRSVVEFQKEFGLTPDGIVGPGTWRKLYDVFYSIKNEITRPPSPSVPQYPGTALRIGSKGSDVLLMQNYLNAISKAYPAIPTIVADGSFGSATQTAVIAFQRQFGLVADGVIGRTTWYKIIDVYNNLSAPSIPQFPGTNLRVGSRGNDVLIMQNYLNAIGKVFPVIPAITADGVFGTGTQSAVIAFQNLFGMSPDGVIGKNTWDAIVYRYNNLPDIVSPKYPGTSLRVGSRGNDVIIMQKYLSAIARQYTSIPAPATDGIFGVGTEQSVKAFQRQFGLSADGVIGLNTWNQIVSIFNMININSSQIDAYSTNNLQDRKKGFDKLAVLLTLKLLRQ